MESEMDHGMLKAEVERLRSRNKSLWADLGQANRWSWEQHDRAEAAEAALASEREAHAGLRARLEALAARFSRFESPTMLTAAVVSRLRALAAEPAPPAAPHAEDGAK